MRHLLALSFCTFLLLNAGIAESARVSIALTGQQAPGAPAGVTYRKFYDAVLNNVGQATFSGYFQGAGVTTSTDHALWSNGFGALSLVAREGSNAPGTPSGVNFSNFVNPTLSRSGATFFYGSLIGAGVTSANDVGYWSNRSGSLELIAREGSQAPGTPEGVVFRPLAPIVYVNRRGDAMIITSLSGPDVSTSNNYGIWTLGDAGLSLAVRTGDQAPGLPNGVRFAGLGSTAFNDAGKIAVGTSLEGDGVTVANNDAIWRLGAGESTLVIREGEQLPGLPAGVSFGGFAEQSGIAFNNAGSVGIVATLVGTGVTAANDAGIWVDRPGGAALIAREGDHPPGAPAATRFAFFFKPKINSGSRAVFRAVIEGEGVTTSNDAAVWFEGPNGLTLLAREGDPAPGAFDNATFRSISSPSINAAGQVAFYATLDDGNVGSIWATDVSGQLHLIALSAYSGSPDFSSNSGNEDGGLMAFDDRGQVIFSADFAGGASGVFVDDAVAIAPGDYNRDGVVASSDLAAWQTAFGHAGPIQPADGDLDGDVDGADLLLWQRQLGRSATSVVTSAAVPEPACAAMIAAGIAALLSHRRVAARQSRRSFVCS
jgi:hypothetical protein